MGKQMIVAEGIFSKLTVELQDGVRDKLALIPTEDNPLAAVEADMKAIISKFEKAYFAAVSDDLVAAPTRGDKGEQL